MMTRRDAVKVIGGVVALGATAGQWRPSAQAIGVRKSVGTLADNGPELTTLRAAISAMKKLPTSNPRSWEKQAAIHRDRCQHANWLFLPWHRAYLLSFERLCQSLGKDPNFRLPYWDWSEQTQIPASFWGTGNVLLNSSRVATASSNTDPEFVGPLAIGDILGPNDFETFGGPACAGRCAFGELEGRAHNEIHNWVGGEMVTMMSPLDPIFWLHHANIDRLWSLWNRRVANPTDGAWLNHTFTNNFVNPDGTPESPVVKSLLSTRPLGYRYDRDPEDLKEFTFAPFQVKALGGGKNVLSVGLNNPLSIQTKVRVPDQVAEALKMAPGLTAPTGLRIRVDGLRPDSAAGARIRVFLNCPYLVASTPIEDPHYVATLSFLPP